MPLISVSLLANSFPTNSFSVKNGYKSKGACSQIAWCSEHYGWGAGYSKKCIINTPWKFLLGCGFFFFFKLPHWNCTPALLTPHHLSRRLYIRKEQLLSFITAGARFGCSSCVEGDWVTWSRACTVTAAEWCPLLPPCNTPENFDLGVLKHWDCIRF